MPVVRSDGKGGQLLVGDLDALLVDAVVPLGAELCSFMNPHLDEKRRRLLAGSMAKALGHGGATTVAQASGMSRNTVIAGKKEFEAELELSERVRRGGGGRPRLIDSDPDLLTNLDDLVAPDARGDPMSTLRWTLKSTRQLAKALTEMGHKAGRPRSTPHPRTTSATVFARG